MSRPLPPIENKENNEEGNEIDDDENTKIDIPIEQVFIHIQRILSQRCFLAWFKRSIMILMSHNMSHRLSKYKTKYLKFMIALHSFITCF